MPETSEYTRLGDGGNQSLHGRWQYLTRLEKGLILISTVFAIVIFSLAVALAKCDAQVPPNVTTVVPETTTAPSSTTVAPSSTTAKPSSTTAEPSSTTVAPSSTTAKPSSTTVAPSSTTAKPSSTTAKPSSTTVAPSSTTAKPSTVPPVSSTVAPSSTNKPKPNNDTENTDAENIKQLPLESTTSSDLQISETAKKILKNIPPIPVTGIIKLVSPEKDETTTTKILADIEETVTAEISTLRYSIVPESNTKNSKSISDTILSRKKRIDVSLTAEGKKDNPIYE